MPMRALDIKVDSIGRRLPGGTQRGARHRHSCTIAVTNETVACRFLFFPPPPPGNSIQQQTIRLLILVSRPVAPRRSLTLRASSESKVAASFASTRRVLGEFSTWFEAGR